MRKFNWIKKVFSDAKRSKMDKKRLVFYLRNNFDSITERIEYKTDTLWTADELCRMTELGYEIAWDEIKEEAK